jgi:hypothetical protein
VLRAERRRRGDLVGAAVLVVVVAIGIAVVIAFSPAAHTTSVTAPEPPPAPPAPTDVPAAFTEAWRAPSAATSSPVVVGPAVVTGDDSTVVGRDPMTGAQRWSYRRNIPLCTVSSGWDLAIAVYRNGAYCSEVTSLQPGTGVRGPQRNSDVPPDTRLLDDGNLVTATGSNHLETWRSDLVKTMEYGTLRAAVQPDTQPRPDCLHTSVAAISGRLGVLERCPGEAGDRLTVLQPDGSETDHPREESSTGLPSTGARLIALTADRSAVLLPNPTRLSIRGLDGTEIASYPLDLPASDLAGDPPGELVPTTIIPGVVLWWTGSRTIALSADELRPLWTVADALGPGTLMADKPVLPTPAGLAVINPSDGAVARTIPVDRGEYRGPVILATIGPVLLEQRGPTVVALH